MALARPTHVGGRTTGPFAARLVDRLRPAALAMCGVCAGNPADTALGDLVVGEPVHEWDEGKHSPSGFEGDHRQIPMDGRWLRAAQDFDPTSVASYGEASKDEALLWFLEQLHRGQRPRSHPALGRYFPSGTWQPRLARLEEQGLIVREPTGEAVLTSAGSEHFLVSTVVTAKQGEVLLPAGLQGGDESLFDGGADVAVDPADAGEPVAGSFGFGGSRTPSSMSHVRGCVAGRGCAVRR